MTPAHHADAAESGGLAALGAVNSPGADAAPAALSDLHDPAPVVDRTMLHRGRVWDLVSETFDLPGVGRLTREFIDHPGAVAVVALDEQERMLLIRQYRHPIGMHEWELPAGLLDVPGEPALVTAQRELFEEADLRASEWHRLLAMHNSPGGTSEHLTIFLARGMIEVPESQRHQRSEEEKVMLARWISLDEIVDAVLAGRMENATLGLGCLAAARLRDAGWQVPASDVAGLRSDSASRRH